jgi:hypothetical protein
VTFWISVTSRRYRREVCHYHHTFAISTFLDLQAIKNRKKQGEVPFQVIQVWLLYTSHSLHSRCRAQSSNFRFKSHVYNTALHHIVSSSVIIRHAHCPCECHENNIQASFCVNIMTFCQGCGWWEIQLDLDPRNRPHFDPGISYSSFRPY